MRRSSRRRKRWRQLRRTSRRSSRLRGPQLKENGPQTLADVVLPESFDSPSLSVDGEAVEIVAAEGLANRRYLWVPSLNAVFGGVMIFSGVHVWVADTPTKKERAAWVANLDRIAARRPAVVVPGHLTAGIGDRRLGDRLRGELPIGLRRGAGQGCRRWRADGRHGGPLRQPWHGRRSGAWARRSSRAR